MLANAFAIHGVRTTIRTKAFVDDVPKPKPSEFSSNAERDTHANTHTETRIDKSCCRVELGIIFKFGVCSPPPPPHFPSATGAGGYARRTPDCRTRRTECECIALCNLRPIGQLRRSANLPPFTVCLLAPFCACHDDRVHTSFSNLLGRSHSLGFLFVVLALTLSCISKCRRLPLLTAPFADEPHC